MQKQRCQKRDYRVSAQTVFFQPHHEYPCSSFPLTKSVRCSHNFTKTLHCEKQDQVKLHAFVLKTQKFLLLPFDFCLFLLFYFRPRTTTAITRVASNKTGPQPARIGGSAPP